MLQPQARLRSVPAELEVLLTVREVASMLNVSTATVYKLCADGELASVRLLNAIRVARSAVKDFMGS